MKPNRLPLGRCALVLALSFSSLLSGQALRAQDGSGRETGTTEEPVRLAPLTVTAVYPTITVKAKLSGRSLFDPANDRVVALRVIRVTADGEIDREEIEVGDQLIAINDTDLNGLKLHQIATVLAEARQSGLPTIRLRRGLAVLEIPFDGKWDPALPGLAR